MKIISALEDFASKIQDKNSDIKKTSAITIPEPKTTQKIKIAEETENSFDYLKKYPFFLDCKHHYDNTIVSQNSQPAANNDYSKPALNSTYNLRIVRAVTFYFPIENKDEAYIVEKSALEFFELYFPSEGKKILEDKNYELAKKITGFGDNIDAMERSNLIIDWITDLVKVGWHLCSNT